MNSFQNAQILKTADFRLIFFLFSLFADLANSHTKFLTCFKEVRNLVVHLEPHTAKTRSASSLQHWGRWRVTWNREGSTTGERRTRGSAGWPPGSGESDSDSVDGSSSAGQHCSEETCPLSEKGKCMSHSTRKMHLVKGSLLSGVFLWSSRMLKECIRSMELGDYDSVGKQNRSQAPRILNKGMIGEHRADTTMLT